MTVEEETIIDNKIADISYKWEQETKNGECIGCCILAACTEVANVINKFYKDKFAC